MPNNAEIALLKLRICDLKLALGQDAIGWFDRAKAAECDRDHARAIAATLAHACDHDARPPEEALSEARRMASVKRQITRRGERIWVCDHCQKRALWGKGWRYYDGVRSPHNNSSDGDALVYPAMVCSDAREADLFAIWKREAEASFDSPAWMGRRA